MITNARGVNLDRISTQVANHVRRRHRFFFSGRVDLGAPLKIFPLLSVLLVVFRFHRFLFRFVFTAAQFLTSFCFSEFVFFVKFTDG